MHLTLKIILAASLMILILLPVFVTANPSTEDLRSELIRAFKAIIEAERNGGDPSQLVKDLNEALMFIRDAEMTGEEELVEDAYSKIDQVVKEAPNVKEHGILEAKSKFNLTILTLIFEGLAAILAYIYVPRIYWRLWLYTKRKMGVHKS